MTIITMRGGWDRVQTWLYESIVAAGIDRLYDRFVESVTPRIDDGSSVLEVGCGQGQVASRLALEMPDCNVVGVDLSPDMVRRARARSGSASNLEFQQGDVASLPFDDDRFDAALSVASIKHWPDRERGVREILRVLRPGALLCILEVDRACTRDEAARFAASWRNVIPGSGVIHAWYFRRFVADQSLDAEGLVGVMRDAGVVEIEHQHVAGLPFVVAWGLKERR